MSVVSPGRGILGNRLAALSSNDFCLISLCACCSIISSCSEVRPCSIQK